ncbi:MAG: hypothetical protein WCP23_11080 [Planctomycetota bacterium]
MGRSDRAHAGFYRAGYLLEDLAGLAPTENLRSDCFVLGYEWHGRLVPTLVINPSGRPSGCAMHSEGITNGFGADAQELRKPRSSCPPNAPDDALRTKNLEKPWKSGVITTRE